MADGGPPNNSKHVAGWQTKVDQGPTTWRVVYVSKKRRCPSLRDESLSPAKTVGAGATANKGESRSSLTHQHDNRHAQIGGPGAGR